MTNMDMDQDLLHYKRKFKPSDSWLKKELSTEKDEEDQIEKDRLETPEAKVKMQTHVNPLLKDMPQLHLDPHAAPSSLLERHHKHRKKAPHSSLSQQHAHKKKRHHMP